MKLTLTTSFFNSEEFVEQLYNNILSQTYKNWEWIVTDDFSSDNTLEIIQSISKNDKRVKYVEQNKKKEMFYNPQKFCKDAEIIFQLDADDLMLNNALDVYQHFFTKFPEVDLITCYSNKYQNGNWYNFGGTEIPLENNLASGHLTYLRAWRNKYSDLDFNPNDWMKYFYNDLSIICKIEEMGKVLILPRALYKYTIRPDSISNVTQSNIPELREENRILINSINDRRNDKDMDTFERYFNPIHMISKGLLDYKFNNVSEYFKFSLIKENLTSYQKNLLKELFYDFDINFNNFSKENDYIIFFIENELDIKLLDDNLHEIYSPVSSQKIQVIISDYSSRDEDFKNIISSKILDKYRYEYYISEYMIINIS